MGSAPLRDRRLRGFSAGSGVGAEGAVCSSLRQQTSRVGRPDRYPGRQGSPQAVWLLPPVNALTSGTCVLGNASLLLRLTKYRFYNNICLASYDGLHANTRLQDVPIQWYSTYFELYSKF